MLMEAKLIGWISSKCCEQKCALKFYKKKKLVKWVYSCHNPLLKIGDTAAFFPISIGIIPCLMEAENKMNKQIFSEHLPEIKQGCGWVLHAAFDRSRCHRSSRSL